METKKCSKCGEEKELTEFYKRKNSKDGFRNDCKECRIKAVNRWTNDCDKNNKEKRSIYCKEYNEKNKEKLAEQKKLYRKENIEKLSKYEKQYYKDNKEKIKSYIECNKERIKIYRKKYKEKMSVHLKEYHEKNKEKIAERSKQYYKNNKERISEIHTKYRYSNASYKRFSKKLTMDESPRLAEDGVSLEVKCRHCGKYFIPTNKAAEHRVRSLNGSMEGDCSLYCSGGCKEECPIYKQNTYPKGFKPATSREVDPLIRQMCFERDEWKCQICGLTQNEVSLHCHHIEGYTQNPLLGNDIDNVITLCKNCHINVHKLPECSYRDLSCSKE